jgi:hypothetical protein
MPLDKIAIADDTDNTNAVSRKMIVEEMRQVLGDMVVAFDQLSDKIAASSTLGGHPAVRPVAALIKPRKSPMRQR